MSRFPVHPAGQRRQEIIDRLSGKKSKQEVNYRAHDNDTNEQCSECVSYLSPGVPQAACKLVAGIVEGEMLCDLFKARPVEGSSSQGAQVNINIKVGN
jgi:hypothetical protein